MPIGINPKKDEQQQQNIHRRNAHARYAHAYGQCRKTSTCKARIKGTCMLIVEYLSTYYIVWCACSQPFTNRHIILCFMGNVCNGKLKFRSMAIVFVCVNLDRFLCCSRTVIVGSTTICYFAYLDRVPVYQPVLAPISIVLDCVIIRMKKKN